MKKLGLLVALFLMTFTFGLDAQWSNTRQNDQRDRMERNDRMETADRNGKQHKKHLKKHKIAKKKKMKHLHQMKRRAISDGKITPRERRKMKRAARRVY